VRQMANSSKRKGDRAEIEVQGILRDLLGVPARRALGAGRKDDVGDITGVPDTVIQVADWKNVTRAVREKPLECEEQRERASDVQSLLYSVSPEGDKEYRTVDRGPNFAATFVRLRGGEYRVVLTPEQWAAMWREAV
jgi:hypothetical protein